MNDPHDNAQTDREALERYGTTLTHAVTQPQPLAWAMASGHCPVICSVTRPDMARIGEPIGIHAKAGEPRWTPAALEVKRTLEMLGLPLVSGDDWTCGALVGVARLKGVILADPEQPNYPGEFFLMRGRTRGVSLHLSPAENQRIRPWWRPGTKWGLLLDEAVLLSEPIQMRGTGGVWRLPYDDAGADEQHPAVWALEQWRKGRAAR